MFKKNLPYFIIVTLAIGLDVLTKFLIRDNFLLHESKTIIDGFFNIIYVLNPGAIFGFLSNIDDSYRRWFFIAISILAAVIIIYMLIKEKNVLSKVSLSLILAGALGNMIDRLHTGYVVDFLDFYIGTYHWYTFNIADVCITTGISLMILDILINKRG